MYVMACYGAKSSSALSVLTLIRYSFSGLAVHAAEPWFTGMGLQWAFSLLGPSRPTLRARARVRRPRARLVGSRADAPAPPCLSSPLSAAFVSLALCAIPFVFYRWGPTIRARSKFIA